jgi:hypothetical protein
VFYHYSLQGIKHWVVTSNLLLLQRNNIAHTILFRLGPHAPVMITTHLAASHPVLRWTTTKLWLHLAVDLLLPPAQIRSTGCLDVEYYLIRSVTMRDLELSGSPLEIHAHAMMRITPIVMPSVAKYGKHCVWAKSKHILG